MKTAIFLGISLLASVPSFAAVTYTSLAVDGIAVDSDGDNIGDGISDANFVNAASFSGSTQAGVFVFELPALLAGESYSAAEFTLSFEKYAGSSTAASATYNVDLYGLTRSLTATANTLINADFYEGANDTANDKIVDDFVTNASSFGLQSTTDASLLSFLNTNAAKTSGTNFVFLRVSPDADITAGSSTGYQFGEESMGTRATLEVTVIPEPSSVALFLGGFGLLFLRRRR